MLRKVLSGLFIASLLVASCVKSNTKCSYNDSSTVAPAAEVASLQDSLTKYNITATKNATGFFYTVNQAGSGTSVTNLCSNVTVTYKGRFFNGAVFDSTVTNQVATFQLGQVIVGWQKGVPLISKSGDITLYIPPTLAYGPTDVKDQAGKVIIPGNSYLIFNIHLADIQ